MHLFQDPVISSSGFVGVHTTLSTRDETTQIDRIPINSHLRAVGNGGVDLLSGERLVDLEFTDDIVLLCDDTQVTQERTNS
ncbi:unnamed protein product [Schistosoma mattheei]|uniref:Uncharacterized protein n=1 Tax=Schistosoma mattheei TaxID=31246 RepID=A0A183P5P2_9TREM|nr:unnamed protein product [Schistosoma mattheei]